MNEQERHNRNVMLRRVQSVWVDGLLAESLHGGEIIDLGFAYRPSALAGSDLPDWQQAPEYDYLMPLGTKIWEVFDAADGVLLVLGEPGAGKTTMLLQLVTDLLDRARQDEMLPIPAVFRLAGYTNDLSLAEWLVDELANNYEVPRKLSTQWIEEQRFIPLLDGLDEVDPDHRADCALAINDFRTQHGGVSLLVTARVVDYHALATRLNMDKAIVLQPLNAEQIDEYLTRRGGRLEGLRATLQKDVTLQELAQSPLMLSIMMLAYNNLPQDVSGKGTLDRQQLFEVYVEQMARYRTGEGSYAPEETIHWLSFLARQLKRTNRPMFFMENMQPDWLPPAPRQQFVRGTRLRGFLTLATAGLIAGLVGLVIWDWPALVLFLVAGLLMAGLPVLTGRFLIRGRLPWTRIETVESLGWSWPWAALGLALGALGGLGLGALFSWLDSRTAAPWMVLLPIAAGLSQMVENALLRSETRLRTEPGQGITRSRRNGRLVGVAVATIVVLFSLGGAAVAGAVGDSASVPHSLPWITWVTLFLGTGYALVYGGLAAWQHRRLQMALGEQKLIPGDLVAFLDYAAERNLMRKVGGGYTFAHALLLDYFSRRDAGATQ